MKQGGGFQGRHPILQGMLLQDAIDELCERKQSLLLATPYLTFESRFIERAGPDLRIRATMSRNVVRHALSQNALRLRFPWDLTFYGGPTRILDYEEGEKAKYLRITLPTALGPDDLRRTYRAEQVGRSTGALGSQDLNLVRVSLENASADGIGVFCLDPLPPDGFQPGRKVDISLSLERGPRIQGQGRICHGTGQSLGVCFSPALDPAQQEALNAWLQPRLEEAQRRWEDRASIRAHAERASMPKAPPSGVLLVASDSELQAAMARALNADLPLRWVPPVLALFREAMEQQPPLVLVLAASGGLEESHRLRSLLEAVAHPCPVVVLSTGSELEPIRALASELKATLFLDRNTLNSAFFQRLIGGLIRKHWNLLEGGGPT